MPRGVYDRDRKSVSEQVYELDKQIKDEYKETIKRLEERCRDLNVENALLWKIVLAVISK